MTAFEKYSVNYEKGMIEIQEKVASDYLPQLKNMIVGTNEEAKRNCLQACMMAYHREMKDMIKRIDADFEKDKAYENIGNQEMTVKFEEVKTVKKIEEENKKDEQ